MDLSQSLVVSGLMAQGTKAIAAGGPGSGRHEEFGKFKRAVDPKDSLTTKYKGETDRWKTKQGSEVHITDKYDGKKGQLTEIREMAKGAIPKLVHKGTYDTAGTFVKSRYGFEQNS